MQNNIKVKGFVNIHQKKESNIKKAVVHGYHVI